jgi:hypothetical protein
MVVYRMVYNFIVTLRSFMKDMLNLEFCGKRSYTVCALKAPVRVSALPRGAGYWGGSVCFNLYGGPYGA